MFIYLRAVVELRAAKARAKPSVLINNWRPEKSTSFKPLKVPVLDAEHLYN